MNSKNDSLAIAKTLFEVYRAIRGVSSFTIGEYNELSILSHLRRDGSMRVTAIVEQEGLTQPGVTAILRRLKATDDIIQISDESDGRASLVTITKSGLARLTHAEEQATSRLSQYIHLLDDSDQQSLQSVQPTLKRFISTTHSSADLNNKEKDYE